MQSDISQLENDFQNYLNSHPGPSSLLQTNLFCQAYIQQKIQDMFPNISPKTTSYIISKHITEKELLELHKSIESLYEIMIQNLENQYFQLQKKENLNQERIQELEINNSQIQQKLEEFIKECYETELENQENIKIINQKDQQIQELENKLIITKDTIKEKYVSAQSQLEQMEKNYKDKIENIVKEKEEFQRNLEIYAQKAIETQYNNQSQLNQIKQQFQKENETYQQQINRLQDIIQEKEQRNIALLEMVQKFNHHCQNKEIINQNQKTSDYTDFFKNSETQQSQIDTEITRKVTQSTSSNFPQQKKNSNQKQTIEELKKKNCRLCEQIKEKKDVKDIHLLHNHI